MRRLLAALAFAFVAGIAAAQDLERPLLLVASPELHGFYSRTALLVVPMDGGHAGFILNRATKLKLAAVFPGHAPSAKVVEPIFLGGPENVESIFAVVRRDPGQPSVRLLDDLFATANAQAVDRIIEHTPNDARYFAGFVGWRPGELAAELDKGYWYLSVPDASMVFRHDPELLWDELVERLGNGRAPERGIRL